MTQDPYSWYVILAEHQTYSHLLQHQLSSVPNLQSIRLPNQLEEGSAEIAMSSVGIFTSTYAMFHFQLLLFNPISQPLNICSL